MKKIKSITDVITNSSTEVFCYKLDDPEYERIKKAIPWLYWDEFRTEEDIKKIVMDPDYYELPWLSGVQCDHGPEDSEPVYDIMSEWSFREHIKDKKTPDEIWEFIKSFYMNLLGKAVCCFENDCISNDQYEDVSGFLGDIHREKVEKILDSFKPGDIIEAELLCPLISNGKTGPILIKKVTDTEFDLIPESWEEFGVFKEYDKDKVINGDWSNMIRLETLRLHEEN